MGNYSYYSPFLIKTNIFVKQNGEVTRPKKLNAAVPELSPAPAAYLLASVLGFGARVLLSDDFQVHDPAPKPAEVRSQAAAGFTGGDVSDLVVNTTDIRSTGHCQNSPLL